MHVLITGAGGHIGTAVVAALAGAGHDVTGLARSAESADAIERSGGVARRGDVRDTDQLLDAVATCDAVVHLAFDNAAALAGDLAGAAAADLAVVEALGDALDGSGRALVAIGTAPGQDPAADAAAAANPRFAVAQRVATFPDRGIRSALVAVPPVVHSDRDRTGFVPTLIALARATGVSAYVGDGTTRWPAVHTLDLAQLFRLVVERAQPGAAVLGAAEPGVPVRRVAEIIGDRLGVPVRGVAPEDADAHFGGFGPIMRLGFPPLHDPRTTEPLGWTPARPGLLDDLAGVYLPAG